jgi:uncharacterized protein
MPDALAIFAKAPVVGQVKTRLSPPLSPAQATELYRCFLLDTVERMCTLPDMHVYIAFTPADSEPMFRAFLPFPLAYLPQRGDSLGERQRNVFIDLLALGFSRIVVIGSDIPTLPLAHVETAFTRLNDLACAAVIGPTRDGGYCLIGARSPHPALFDNIAWSTPLVMEQTLEQARRHRLQVSLLPPWFDVDTAEDVQRLATELGQGNADASRTRMFLSQLGLWSLTLAVIP